jgi:hypothetical protein
MPYLSRRLDMTTGQAGRPAASTPPQRVRPSHVEWVAERLTERDWAILETVNRLRLASGDHLARLHFSSLASHSRDVVRGRVLRRLVAWRSLVPLPRRVGGNVRGSAGLVFALDSAGRQLLAQRQAGAQLAPRVRRAGPPTDRTVAHTLAVTELYVSLVEQTRQHGAEVAVFEAEPAAWWPDGLGGYVKPDAYALLVSGDVRDHWWVEADLASESLPTLRRKLLTYLDFVQRGQLGPSGVMPRVLVSAVTEQRAAAITALVKLLPAPAIDLMTVAWAPRAPHAMYQVLRE